MNPPARLVVDTDVISLIFRDDSRASFYLEVIDGCSLLVSFMTIAELHRWTLRRDWGVKRRLELEAFLSNFAMYNSDDILCERWAEVTEMGRKQGRPINCADAWIAATAFALDCPLVTHNPKDYEMIGGLQVISQIKS